MDVLADCIQRLEVVAKRTEGKLLVSYSGGKDSLAILDIASRIFDHIECFFMYFLPDMQCVQPMLKFAEENYKVTIHQYPHWALAVSLREGIFCDSYYTLASLDWSLKDIYTLVVDDTEIPAIAVGARRKESQWRRRTIKQMAKIKEVVYPIENWTKLDVIGYLKRRGLPVPRLDKDDRSGVGLSPDHILWLYKHWPQDYAKIVKRFPYIEAVIWRERFYGESEKVSVTSE